VGEGSLLAERADVELVDHEVVDRHAAPTAVAPLERPRVEDARGALHALRLPARAGIGPRLAVGDEEIVVAAERADPVLAVPFEPGLFLNADGAALARGRPHAPLSRAVAARHGPQPTHSRLLRNQPDRAERGQRQGRGERLLVPWHRLGLHAAEIADA